MAYSRKLKVVLLGEGRVGKTSILLRYIKGEYNDKQLSTLQASFLEKKMVLEGQNVQLAIWDTAGQERFHALGPIYYRDADGAILVYDITDETSFQKVRKWVQELRKIVGPEINIVIAGNKIDLQRQRKVNEQEAIKYAKTVGAKHFNTSAKLGKGLEDLFVGITKDIVLRKGKERKGHALLSDSPRESDYGISSGAGGTRTGARSRPGAGAGTGGSAAGGGRRDGGRPKLNFVEDSEPSLSFTLDSGNTRNGGATGGRSASSGGSGKEKSGCC